MRILPNNVIEIDLIPANRLTPKSITFNISEVASIGLGTYLSRHRILRLNKLDFVVNNKTVEGYKLYLISDTDAAILKTLLPTKVSM